MTTRSGPTPEPSREELRAALHERLVDRIRSVKGGGRLIQLACGSGTLTLHIAEARPDLEILGLDTSTDRLRMATEAAIRVAASGRVRFERADFSVLPLPDRTASILVAVGVLGAAVNPRAVASEIHRVLANDGVALLVEDVPEGGGGGRRGTLLPSLGRPGRDEEAIHQVIAGSSFRDDATFTRQPLGEDRSFLEITLKRPAPPPREPTSWRSP
jgi:SAM-dependent methyltransferase